MSFTFEEIPLLDTFDAAIRHHKTGNVFVHQPWLKFTVDNSNGKFIGLKIQDDAFNISFFAGILFCRFGVKIIGSPFRGWGTPYMGVFGNIQIDQNFVRELLNFLFERYQPHYLEIINSSNGSNILSCAEFSVSTVESIRMNLMLGTAELFSKLKGDCRTYLRQFESKGCSLVVSEPNQLFVDVFYNQLAEVFSNQGMVPTYSKQRVINLLSTLKAGGVDLLCLQARSPNSEVIASSIFFGEAGIFYYWAGASYLSGRHFRPNESMIWFAIQHFFDHGYHSFDMVGVRDYKLKFSPELIHYNKIVATPFKFLTHFRDLAERLYFVSNRIKGWLSHFGASGDKFRLSSNLFVKSVADFEHIHYQSNDKYIFSRRNVVHIVGDLEHTITLPIGIINKMLSSFRLLRRAFRLDKINIIAADNGYIILWRGSVYHWSNENGLHHKLTLVGCRNIMHNSIARISGLKFVFGEYGRSNRSGKNVYQTDDGGVTWRVVFNFPSSDIDHIHCCKWDHFSQRIWMFTGDSDGHCKVISSSLEFTDIVYYGDGSQLWRATGAFFDRNHIHWIMDSPLSAVRHVNFNKLSGEIELGQTFPGPVYYYATTLDGVHLVCTAQEPGEAIRDKCIHIFASRNLKKWIEVGQLPSDGYPFSPFRFGVGYFPDGEYLSNDFLMSFDAVKQFDGKVVRLSLKGI
jgi:hypothetical protein